jgi:hypothetical protein
MKTYGGGGIVSRSTILALGTGLKMVVSFTPRQLYSWRKNPRYPLHRRRGGPRSGLDANKYRKISHVLGMERQSLSPYSIPIENVQYRRICIQKVTIYASRFYQISIYFLLYLAQEAN